MVYDLDREEYIEESAEDTNDVLDNMLEACEYMMDMLGLDESKHGSAYDRYMNIANNKYNELKNKAHAEINKRDKLRRIENDRSTNDYTAAEAKRMADDHNMKVNEYNGRAKMIYHAGIEPYVNTGGASKTIARRKWGNDINDSNNGYHVPDKGGKFKTSEGLSSKYEAKDQKKKAVKEACLAILSALDDIE